MFMTVKVSFLLMPFLCVSSVGGYYLLLLLLLFLINKFEAVYL